MAKAATACRTYTSVRHRPGPMSEFPSRRDGLSWASISVAQSTFLGVDGGPVAAGPFVVKDLRVQRGTSQRWRGEQSRNVRRNGDVCATDHDANSGKTRPCGCLGAGTGKAGDGSSRSCTACPRPRGRRASGSDSRLSLHGRQPPSEGRLRSPSLAARRRARAACVTRIPRRRGCSTHSTWGCGA